MKANQMVLSNQYPLENWKGAEHASESQKGERLRNFLASISQYLRNVSGVH